MAGTASITIAAVTDGKHSVDLWWFPETDPSLLLQSACLMGEILKPGLMASVFKGMEATRAVSDQMLELA